MELGFVRFNDQSANPDDPTNLKKIVLDFLNEIFLITYLKFSCS